MVHAVLAGITRLQMLAINLTKLYVVDRALLGGLFVFIWLSNLVNYLNLGGFDLDGGGNRYQSRLFILFSRGNSPS